MVSNTEFICIYIYAGYPVDVFQNQAAANSTALQNYSKGVQMGCWGLVIYAATAALCSGVCCGLVLYFGLDIANDEIFFSHLGDQVSFLYLDTHMTMLWNKQICFRLC